MAVGQSNDEMQLSIRDFADFEEDVCRIRELSFIVYRSKLSVND